MRATERHYWASMANFHSLYTASRWRASHAGS